MRGRSYTLFGSALLLGVSLAAQQPRPPHPPAPPAAPAPFEAVLLQGVDIRVEGPPRTGAPYSADSVTEIVQTLGDGNRIRRENRSSIARDSQGRTRREEELNAIGPWATAGEARRRVFITDPVAGVHWLLEPESKAAYKTPIPGGPGGGEGPAFVRRESGGFVENVQIAIGEAGAASGGSHTIEHVQTFSHTISASPGNTDGNTRFEDLGERTIEGVAAKGMRTTRTIPAGAMGNERPIEIVHERWFSPALGVDLISDRSDPRMGETKYRLTNLRTAEPLPSLFEPPPDYEVKERTDVLLRRPMPPAPPAPLRR